MSGNCPLIRQLRDPDILTQSALGQAVAPTKWPPEAYFPRHNSFSRAALTSGRVSTTIPAGVRAASHPFPGPPAPLSGEVPGGGSAGTRGTYRTAGAADRLRRLVRPGGARVSAAAAGSG